jgi:hypothetical protein
VLYTERRREISGVSICHLPLIRNVWNISDFAVFCSEEDTVMETFLYHFALFDALILGAIVLLLALSMSGHHEA